MAGKEKFSERFGLSSVKEKEITIREDAPEGLRAFIPMAFYELNKNPSDLREIICRILRKPPDRNNWSEFANIDSEVGQHLEEQWYWMENRK
jgi:hypothetical protein